MASHFWRDNFKIRSKPASQESQVSSIGLIVRHVTKPYLNLTFAFTQVIATPGRFVHLCVEMGLRLDSVEYVVFDEADRLFEMGFGEQLREILGRLPDARQTALFSATLPKLLVEFAKAGLSDPTLIRDHDVSSSQTQNVQKFLS